MTIEEYSKEEARLLIGEFMITITATQHVECSKCHCMSVSRYVVKTRCRGGRRSLCEQCFLVDGKHTVTAKIRYAPD